VPPDIGTKPVTSKPVNTEFDDRPKSSSTGAKAPRLEKPVPITEQVWPEGTLPAVSVFNWAYNHAPFIRESIESILMQKTTFPVEIIVHDDASNDGTTEIIREYETRHPRLFRNIIQKQNQWSQGKSVMTPMFAVPRGEMVALTHGDDCWTSPEKLQRQHQVLINDPEVSMCFHNAVEEITTTGERRIFNKRFSRKRFHLEDMFQHAFVIPTASVVYRRDWLPNPQWLHSSLCGDRAMQLLLADIGPFAFIDEAWSVYRTHPGGVTRSVTKDYAEKTIPNWISMYYAFAETTTSRHDRLVQKEIRRLVAERSRFQLYALRDAQTAWREGEPLPDQMVSPAVCLQAVDVYLKDTSSCLLEPDKSWFLQSRLYKSIQAEALVSAGDAWYVRKQYDRAREFYNAALALGKGLRSRLYCALLRLGLAGRATRSILHRLSLAWQRNFWGCIQDAAVRR